MFAPPIGQTKCFLQETTKNESICPSLLERNGNTTPKFFVYTSLGSLDFVESTKRDSSAVSLVRFERAGTLDGRSEKRIRIALLGSELSRHTSYLQLYLSPLAVVLLGGQRQGRHPRYRAGAGGRARTGGFQLCASSGSYSVLLTSGSKNDENSQKQIRKSLCVKTCVVLDRSGQACIRGIGGPQTGFFKHFASFRESFFSVVGGRSKNEMRPRNSDPSPPPR